MTNQAHPKSMQDVLHFLQTEGRSKALASAGPLSVLKMEPNKLVIGTNTVIQTHITKSHNGTIETDNNGYFIPIKDQAPPGYSRFDHLWQAIYNYIESDLYLELQTYLGTEPNQTDALIHPDAAFLQAPQVKQLIHTITTEARASIHPSETNGPHEADEDDNPSHHFMKALTAFLGPIRVKRTLNIAGPSATILDLITLQKHRKTFTQAHSINPNATILWFKHNSFLNWKRNLNLGPEDVLAAAKAVLINQCRSAAPQDSPLLIKPSNHPHRREAEDRIWDTFTSLDHQALRDRLYPQDHREDVKNYAHLSVLATRTTTTIPPWAQKFLLDNPRYLDPLSTPPGLITPFLEAASTARTKAKRADLTANLHTLAHLSEKAIKCALTDPLSMAITQALYLDNPPLPWEAITALIPHKANKAANPPRHVRSCTNSTMHHLVNSTRADPLKLIADRTLTFHTVPGKSVALYEDPTEPPILLFTRHPDGTISGQVDNTATSWYNPANTDLPDPKDPLLARTVTLQHRLSIALSKAAHDYVKANWKNVGPWATCRIPSQDQLSSTLKPVGFTTPEHCKNPLNHWDLLRRLTTDIASLLDPQHYRTAQTIAGSASLKAYNVTASNHQCLADLARSNPGAASWLLIREELPAHPVKHPGQLVSQVKSSMLKAGLEPRNWRFTATLPHQVMVPLAKRATNTNAALILNAAARVNSRPHPDVAHALSALLEPPPQFHLTNTPASPPDNTVTLANNAKFVSISCQESARILRQIPELHQPDLQEALPSLRDYVNHLSSDNQQLTATTWGGLIKASDKWHRQDAIRQRDITWNQYLQASDGHYLAWHSALPTVRVGAYTITPLTDEKQLHFEAAYMDHCVYRYGKDCASGRSRIFSISKDNSKVATTQITNHNGKWTHSQTRGKHNHQANHLLLELMQETVPLKYQQAEATSPQPKTLSWKIEEQPSLQFPPRTNGAA